MANIDSGRSCENVYIIMDKSVKIIPFYIVLHRGIKRDNGHTGYIWTDRRTHTYIATVTPIGCLHYHQ